MPRNLYVHFPFCRRKCAYCALHSRAGVSTSARVSYVASLVGKVASLGELDTVYFGGGTPTLCDLKPLFEALAPHLAENAEFTVELHPLDVTDELLATLRTGGVNRISMGVQSLDGATLAAMGRGHTADGAHHAFDRVRRVFDNAGVDFIVGYPGDPCNGWETLADWGMRHCSVYSLQLEPKTVLSAKAKRGEVKMRDDDWTMDRLRAVGKALGEFGMERYEISNYAMQGFECRHNLAVWRGEDYVGLGEGAFGRVGLTRTNVPIGAGECEIATVTPVEDLRERTIFRLRTKEGLDVSRIDEWSSDPAAAKASLGRAVAEGLLVRAGDAPIYRLTPRGAEVCDSLLADVV